MRLPSVLAGGLTAGFVAAIGLRLFERRTAVLGAVLTAVTLSVVYWNQTARGYAPMLAFTCAGMLAFVALAEPPVAARARRGAAADAPTAAEPGCRCSATWPRWCWRSTAASWRCS